ncbi:MAG: hypothetical protein ACREVE_17330 [Gammaproteobacteria bacterium]
MNLRLVCSYLSLAILLPCMHAAIAGEFKDLNVSTIKALYSDWLNRTGLSSPSTGWELEVRELVEVKCTEKGNDVELLLELEGIDCQDSQSPIPQFILTIGFKHPERIWHNAPTGWQILNDQLKQSEGVSLNERLLFKLSHLLNSKVEATRITEPPRVFRRPVGVSQAAIA